LEEFVKNQYSQVSHGEPLIAGTPVGEGLSKWAAEELGLMKGTPVGSALIDACVFLDIITEGNSHIYCYNRYAGWVGTLAARYEENEKLSEVVPSLQEVGHRLAVIAGTSTCHLVQVHSFPFSSEVIIDIQYYRVPEIFSLMAYGVLTRYIRPTAILVIELSTICSVQIDRT
jgi:ribulose kinase